jgi:hypothetical protein
MQLPSGIIIAFGPLALQLLHTGVQYGNDGNPFNCALLLIKVIKSPPGAPRRGYGIHIQVLGISFIFGWVNEEELPPDPPASGTT